MPAINVARTDTFEIQRQKINQIGDQIFSISQGGSDLATGNLKLGDGTRIAPSLAFTSDPSLGIYKSGEKTIGYVSDGKKIADFESAAFYSFRDIILQKKKLKDAGLTYNNYGSNYDPGTYSNIDITGGTGSGATANITVATFNGSVSTVGVGYVAGTYSSIPLVGGSGSGAIAGFTVSPLSGDITNSGSSYKPGNYTNVPFINGSGNGAIADVTVTGSTVISGNITNSGSGYTNGSYQFVQVLNEPTTSYVVSVVSNPGTPPPDNIFQIDGVDQPTLNLVKGNTYRFFVSDSSIASHPFSIRKQNGDPLPETDFSLINKGTLGNTGSFIDFVIKPSAQNQTLEYYCSTHSGMGGTINITSGAAGSYGTFAAATVSVSGSNVSGFTITNFGSDHKVGDIVSVFFGDIGGTGSGFLYEITGITYDGEITNVTVTDSGSSYLKDDILSFSDSDLGSGGGSSFEYTVTTDPLQLTTITFATKGSGYSPNDVLTLPGNVSQSSVTVPGEKTGVSTTLSDLSAVITVLSTDGIIAGMNVQLESGDGALGGETTVLSVDSSTQITLSSTPSVAGAANLTFRSPGLLNQIVVSDVTGILSGSVVTIASGPAILSQNTTVTSIDTNTNTVTLSQNTVQAGVSNLLFTPPYGNPTVDFEYTTLNIGVVDTFAISDGGNGYSVGDLLSVSPTDLTQPITYSVTNKNLQRIVLQNTSLPSNTFSLGDVIKKVDGELLQFSITSAPSLVPTVVSGITATLSTSSSSITVSSTTGISQGMIVTNSEDSTGRVSSPSYVVSVDSPTTLTLNSNPSISGQATLTFTEDLSDNYVDVASTTDGSGSEATFTVSRDTNGQISNISATNPGKFYSDNDTITISGSDVGGSTPADDILLQVNAVSSSQESVVYEIKLNNGFVESLLVTDISLSDGDNFYISTVTTTEYTILSAGQQEFRFFIDTGSGENITPDLTLYVGNTYIFDLSDLSNLNHSFALSQYRDGIWGPSYIQNVSTNLLTTTAQITIADTSGILPGMEVSQELTDTGELLSSTFVTSVDSSTQLTLSKIPLTAGQATLSFRGVEYTDSVSKDSSSLSIKVTDQTPNLYYYCSISNTQHQNEGGEDQSEALITIDANNPKTFGSGFSITAAELDSTNTVTAELDTGNINCTSVTSDDITSNSATITSLESPSITGSLLNIASIVSNSLTISASSSTFNGNVNIGSTISFVSSTGNITTSGILKTTNSLNINDNIIVTDNNITSTSGNDILLSPATGRVAKVNTNTALIIPAGTSAERPTGGIVANGAVRFNTDSGQYEGYNASTTSWASLGGVRDLDGNTYIAAEASVGANDNTLYFFNDGNNTVSVTPNYLQFVDVKKIRSVNTTAPAYTDYTTNTQVTLGQYLKYQNNIYEVTVAGQTGTSGNEPTHTTGAATNGTAELTWYTTAIAPLTFEEISEVRIDPLGFTDLVVNAELRFSTNVISTDLNDLIIQPNSGKKVSIDAETSLVIPVGDNNQRGVAEQGSIRYNTDISQYEGYDGSNWTSLGGVKDVDGNTYIIPETAPGANENILYFYNDGTNTMRLSANALDFTNIDAITSQNNNLDIEAQTVTFNSLSATIDTSGTSTFISTTKDNLDLGLAVGLNVDPLLRLDINGDIYLNKAFGTGSFDGLKLFNSDLSTFELADLAISTSDIGLIKGGTNAGAATLYDPATQSGARVSVSVVNQTTGDKEMIEYQVIDKGSDIYHTEIGNLKTGANQVTSVFDFDANNNVRVTFTLDGNLTVGDVVNITVVKNIFKN
jgi:hypothetical protein